MNNQFGKNVPAKYLLTLQDEKYTGREFEIEVEAYNADDAIRQGNLEYERNNPRSIVIKVIPSKSS